MRRRTLSGLFFEVMISRNRALARFVAAQIGGDQLQRTGGEARGIGMNGEVVPVGLAKQGDQIDRITLENAVILPHSDGYCR